MARIEAILFDLYGTLIELRSRAFLRGAPRLLGASAARWTRLLRDPLLTREFAHREALVDFLIAELSPRASSELRRECLARLDTELASVRLLPAVPATLAFFSRRGFRLGLLSNLASVYREPIQRLDLERHFSARIYSCEVGLRKPDPEIYRLACRQLGVPPEATLVVGDSRRNDVEAPRALGMAAIWLDAGGGAGSLRGVAELAGCDLASGAAAALLAPGATCEWSGGEARIAALELLGDEQQGRYNLVWRGSLERTGGAVEEVFAKRFLLPEAVHVEAFAHELLSEAGFGGCPVRIAPGSEPILLVGRAPGAKLSGSVDPELSFEIGRHCAAAYVFANADMRPRNAFLCRDAQGRPQLTMLDLEHCLFNLALDPGGLSAPADPATWDRLPAEELDRRLRRRVLSEGSTRRVIRSFFEHDAFEGERLARFRDGWIAGFGELQARRERIASRLRARASREPYLIIGTQAYRRALARLDVADLLTRLDEDPVKNFPRLSGTA